MMAIQGGAPSGAHARALALIIVESRRRGRVQKSVEVIVRFGVRGLFEKVPGGSS
jgi:hypothetical protein